MRKRLDLVVLVVARFGGYVTSWGNFWGNRGRRPQGERGRDPLGFFGLLWWWRDRAGSDPIPHQRQRHGGMADNLRAAVPSADHPAWRFTGYPDEGELIAHARWPEVLALIEEAYAPLEPPHRGALPLPV